MPPQFDLLPYSSLNWKGRRILMRVDCNVPFSANGDISNDFRLRALLPSLRFFLENHCSLVLISHLALKEGAQLKKCADRLQEELDLPVVFVPHRDSLEEQLQTVPQAPLVLLDNLRLHPGEEKNDLLFAKSLSCLGDLFLNEALSCSHRKHASIVSLPTYFVGCCGIGPLFLKELESLHCLKESPLRPRCAIVGGAKLKTKIPLIKSLKEWADEIILVGQTANAFLHILHNTSSLSEEDAPLLNDVLSIIEGFPSLILPVDGIVQEGDALKIVQASQIGPTDNFLDLGPQSITIIQNRLKDQKTIFWNGPAGQFEQKEFSKGTLEIARCLANTQAQTFIAGGDTIFAAHKAGVANKIEHFLSGGGASLTFFQEGSLPGIRALEMCIGE
ncbi:phosphoglycerate kinase [Candidatus Similichlamydia laticola]|uniref:Phosphoglycerate kinase n=1 Tax=Candidatus Similichlamydia laticola TaxID=2170265 RepID=A0A369KB92_9BACT|nr:phosphoglycerate kinase [Candidatus Similichlamydia laticola]RDB31871.1 Phosphoglycerate kinase [Candidatus Similichlamydia laticola]